MNIVQVYKKFPTQNDCLSHLERARWDGKPVCPYCRHSRFSAMKEEHRYHCNACNASFSVTVRTIFHKTHVDLQKWFLAITLMLNARKGISARQLSRDIEVNKNTAWYMAMRIRRAMLTYGKLLRGIVEMDETYIGGDERSPGPRRRGRGTDKKPVIGMVERGGNIIAKSTKNVRRETLSALVRRNVDASAKIYTDEFRGYLGISGFMNHRTVKHKKWYVDGDVHTNNIESFWALLKRGLVGQFHKVSYRHLDRYIDEFCYRHNNRGVADLFGSTLIRAVGGVA